MSMGQGPRPPLKTHPVFVSVGSGSSVGVPVLLLPAHGRGPGENTALRVERFDRSLLSSGWEWFTLYRNFRLHRVKVRPA